MKKRWIFGIIAVLVAACIMACGDDKSYKDDMPGKAVESAFWAKYPSATQVKWDREGNYREADFLLDGTEHEAWFTGAGGWLQTEYSMSYVNIPQAVKNWIDENLVYGSGGWITDRTTDVVERKNDHTWYGVDVEKGTEERTLWIIGTGYRGLEVAEDFDGGDIPASLNRFIAQQYAGSKIWEVYLLVNGSYQAIIFDNDIVKTVYFDRYQNWEYTAWPVLQKDVPVVVLDVLKAQAYQDFEVREVSYRQTAKSEYYHFDLKQKTGSGPDYPLDVTPQGEVILQGI